MENKRLLYIFDIDGTITKLGERRNIIEDKTDPHRWDKFYQMCDMDLPNSSVIQTMELLKRSGAEIWFFTGRPDSVRTKTEEWLTKYTSFTLDELRYPILSMRETGDHTPDDELKESWLNKMLFEDIDRLVAVFDDRDKVVAMWRRNSIQCYQVEYGKF